jgi:phosphoribosylformylglycinamidine synthase subunit PurS
VTWFQVRLLVSLKPGLLDPQGKTVEGALPALGWENVRSVRVGKYLWFEVDAESGESAREQAEVMADRFLTNPVIEDSTILDVRTEGGDAHEAVEAQDAGDLPLAEGTGS